MDWLEDGKEEGIEYHWWKEAKPMKHGHGQRFLEPVGEFVLIHNKIRYVEWQNK